MLAVQIILIVLARFTEARYFCWAPHDSQNDYVLHVTVNEQPLSADAIYTRYRLYKNGRDPRSIQHVKDVLSRYEKTLGKDQPAQITLTYTTNGIKQPVWKWPIP
ncbi:MAG: hypothetical protein AB7S78_06595 [Candidatus Omnitrophota bacterium]